MFEKVEGVAETGEEGRDEMEMMELLTLCLDSNGMPPKAEATGVRFPGEAVISLNWCVAGGGALDPRLRRTTLWEQ
jgi:hypothetical protein